MNYVPNAERPPRAGEKSQRIADFTIVRLGEFAGMPEELELVRLILVHPPAESGGGRPRIYVDDPRFAWGTREAPEPTEVLRGLLIAADALHERGITTSSDPTDPSGDIPRPEALS